MGARWAEAVDKQGRGDEQPRDKGRNPARLQGFGSSLVRSFLAWAYTCTLAHHMQDAPGFLHFLNISGIIIIIIIITF